MHDLGPRKQHVKAASASPCKHDSLKQCCFNVGPHSATLDQQQNNIGLMYRACMELVFLDYSYTRDFVNTIRITALTDALALHIILTTILLSSPMEVYRIPAHKRACTFKWNCTVLGMALKIFVFTYKHTRLYSNNTFAGSVWTLVLPGPYTDGSKYFPDTIKCQLNPWNSDKLSVY